MNLYEVEPETVAEDFARYGRTEEKVPIAMFWLGTVSNTKFQAWENKEISLPGLHNPEFYPDFEPAYKTGRAIET